METKIRDILADFIVKIKFEDLPEQVVHQVKRCLLDFMGMALAGSRLGLSPIVAALIFNQGGAEEATIVGDGTFVTSNEALIRDMSLKHISMTNELLLPLKESKTLTVKKTEIPPTPIVREKLELSPKDSLVVRIVRDRLVS